MTVTRFVMLVVATLGFVSTSLRAQQAAPQGGQGSPPIIAEQPGKSIDRPPPPQLPPGYKVTVTLTNRSGAAIRVQQNGVWDKQPLADGASIGPLQVGMGTFWYFTPDVDDSWTYDEFTPWPEPADQSHTVTGFKRWPPTHKAGIPLPPPGPRPWVNITPSSPPSANPPLPGYVDEGPPRLVIQKSPTQVLQVQGSALVLGPPPVDASSFWVRSDVKAPDGTWAIRLHSQTTGDYLYLNGDAVGIAQTPPVPGSGMWKLIKDEKNGTIQLQSVLNPGRSIGADDGTAVAAVPSGSTSAIWHVHYPLPTLMPLPGYPKRASSRNGAPFPN